MATDETALVCYLDDSGKDPQNVATTLAGYVAEKGSWAEFEAEVEPLFTKYGVDILHTMDLHGTRGDFKGWTVLKKQSFVAQFCSTLSRHALLGVTMSAAKGEYKAAANRSARKKTNSPYTFCSNVILDWLLTDIRVGKKANEEGVAFILEDGHENNPEAEWNIGVVTKMFDLAEKIKSVSFVAKTSCRGIQAADLLAFYSRRHANELLKASPQERVRLTFDPGVMLKIIAENLPHRAFVANGFENPPADTPTWRPPPTSRVTR
jgi:hypothetical protein